MTKRERLLVVAMTGSVLWGASTAVFGFMKSHGDAAQLEQDRAELKQFAETQRMLMQTFQLTGHERVVLAEANAAWATSPFAMEAAGAGPAEQRIREFFYTGHLQVGLNQFAIVNGREYRAGDLVYATDLRVENIQPDTVVLVSTSGNRRVTVELQAPRETRK